MFQRGWQKLRSPTGAWSKLSGFGEIPCKGVLSETRLRGTIIISGELKPKHEDRDTGSRSRAETAKRFEILGQQNLEIIGDKKMSDHHPC